MDVLVEVDEYTADVPIPEDTVDEIDATTVAQGLQAVANRTKYLNSFGIRVVDVAVEVVGGTGLLKNVTAAAYEDLGLAVSANVATVAGDRIVWSASFQADPNSCTDGFTRVAYSENGGAYATPTGAERTISGATWMPMTLTGVHQVSTAGTFALKAQGKCSAGDWQAYNGASIHMTIYRKGSAW